MSLEMTSLYTAIVNAKNLRFVKRQKLAAKVEKMIIDGGGNLAPIDYAVAFQESEYEIETPDLANLFGGGGTQINLSLMSGLSCTSGATLQYQSRLDGGFAGNGNHFTFASPLDFLLLQAIEATQDENKPVMAQCLYYLLEKVVSGTPTYITPATGQNLTSSPLLDVKYALGPVYINGVEYSENTKSRFETGAQYKPTRAGGQVVARAGAIKKTMPKFAFDFKNVTMLSTFGVGLSEAPGTVAMYLQKIDADGDRVATTTAEHIKISATTSKVETSELDGGDGDDDAVCKAEFHVKSGATVAISLASQIP